jgi:hypothetical protein
MTHPNQYPGKVFIPYEGDMEVETIEMPVPTPDREGIAVVTEEDIVLRGKAPIYPVPESEWKIPGVHP